jgi:proteasome lid subunit RPN8/RPN11
MDTILECARSAGGSGIGDESNERKEIIGLLFGMVDGGKLKITGFNSDDRHSSPVHAELDDEFMAQSAQRVVDNPHERVVGWWHTHPSYGCFMSETDIKTQRKLEKFGQVAALVVDPTGHLDFSFYTCDDESYHPLPYAIMEELDDWVSA